MIKSRKYDIVDENFDEYFFQIVDTMTMEQLERVPNELSAKVRRGAKYSLESLTFVQKLYLLTTVFRKRWTFIIEDEQGSSLEAFEEIQKGYRDNHSRLEAVEELRNTGSFYLGGMHLMQRMEYVVLQCASNVYKAISGYRSAIHERRKKIQSQRDTSESVLGVFRLLMNYEANKFRFVDYGVLSLSEWYAIMFLYENEAKPAQFHDKFLYSYSSGKRNRINAISRLQLMGLVDSRAKKRSIHTKYYLTQQGKELAIKIMERVVLNY